MKRALALSVGAVALAAMSFPAAAADLGARPITKAPVAAPPPVYNWTSCYIGVNGGGKWSHLSGDVAVDGVLIGVPFAGVSNNSNNGGGFGGQLGCQWQAGGWVFGVEGDFDGTSLKRTLVAPTGFEPFLLAGDAFEIKNDWQASVRGRIGYAWDRLLVYATGGVAFAEVKASAALVAVPFGTPVFFASASDTRSGGTFGAGFEYAFWDNFSIGVKYRHSEFGHANFAFAGLAAVPVATDLKFRTDEVTGRLNWHFNWFGGGPVAARY